MKGRFKRLVKFTSDYQKKEEIILRDHLSMERTKLANERTFLSYLRTSLYLVLGGIAFLGMEDLQKIRPLGYVSLVLSGIVMVAGVVRFYQLKRHLKRMYEPLQKPEPNKKEENENSAE